MFVQVNSFFEISPCEIDQVVATSRGLKLKCKERKRKGPVHMWACGGWTKADSSSWRLKSGRPSISPLRCLHDKLAHSVSPAVCETEISTFSNILCNCLTYSNYSVENRVTARPRTYVSHTSSYEVMFPWHRPLRRVGVFHRGTMTDEGERCGRREVR